MPTNSASEQRTHVCHDHDKKCYTTRDQAKRAIRQLHDKGMREYRCDINPAFWHVGHLPNKVRRGKRTADEHYGRASAGEDMTQAFYSSPGADGPLTFRPSPLDIRPLNGTRPTIPVVDNSIESLLSAAEASGVQTAQELASQIRGLVAQLVREVRIGEQERELEARIAELEVQRDKAIVELRELRGEPEPAAEPTARSLADNFPPSGNQAAIRAWARENGIEVKGHGAISVRVRDAYQKAMGGA